MSKAQPDLEGKFGKLTIIAKIDNPKQTQRRDRFYLCKCECGEETIVRQDKLKEGSTKSCGCFASIKKGSPGLNTKHNMSKFPEYRSWQGIKNRCFNENCDDYKDYGGRGITVQESWIDSFENFIADMGRMPNKGWSIDRIDVNKGYCKENCRWADKYTQARNRRNNHVVEFNGLKKTLIEWSEITGISNRVIARRLKRGWTIERTLTTKKEKRLQDVNNIECTINQSDKENV